MATDSPEEAIQLPPKTPLLIVISGPSAVGKDVTLKRMQERGAPFHFVVTHTTRPRRPYEKDGVDYHFDTPEEFRAMLERGEFLEHAIVYGHEYGNARREVQDALDRGEDVILRIDTQGAETIRRRVAGAVFIFMTATRMELETRLRQRHTESEEALRVRLEKSQSEMQEMSKFDYVVANHDGALDPTVDDIMAIIRSKKLCAHPREVEFR